MSNTMGDPKHWDMALHQKLSFLHGFVLARTEQRRLPWQPGGEFIDVGNATAEEVLDSIIRMECHIPKDDRG